MMQPPTGITHHRFSLFRFRSPLLTESLLFSLPAGTEMFHFPAFPPTGLYIQPAVTHHNNEQGFPIRTSSDQRLIGNSPRLNAALHVLHRLDMPRHPPCALTTNTPPTPTPHTGVAAFNGGAPHEKHTQNNTKEIKQKNDFASTIQFSHNTTPPPATSITSRQGL